MENSAGNCGAASAGGRSETHLHPATYGAADGGRAGSPPADTHPYARSRSGTNTYAVRSNTLTRTKTI